MVRHCENNRMDHPLFHSCYFFHNNIPLRQAHIDKVPEIQRGWSLASSSTNVILVTLFFSQLVTWHCTGTKKCLVIFHFCTHLVHMESYRQAKGRFGYDGTPPLISIPPCVGHKLETMAVKKVVKSIHWQLTIVQTVMTS